MTRACDEPGMHGSDSPHNKIQAAAGRRSVLVIATGVVIFGMKFLQDIRTAKRAEISGLSNLTKSHHTLSRKNGGKYLTHRTSAEWMFWHMHVGSSLNARLLVWNFCQKIAAGCCSHAVSASW